MTSVLLILLSSSITVHALCFVLMALVTLQSPRTSHTHSPTIISMILGSDAGGSAERQDTPATIAGVTNPFPWYNRLDS